MNQTVLVTGGAGFIGSNFVLEWLDAEGSPVVNLDKLTYAGNLENLASLRNDPRHIFVYGDICDRQLVRRLLSEYRPRAILHFAAETHVDRSIYSPGNFIQTNVVGTFHCLEESYAYWSGLEGEDKRAFRFLHVSTDEVYGSLEPEDPPSTEAAPYAPNSPYSASKAAADHLVRVYHRTYGLPTLITHCANTYGPYQFPEKLIPLMLLHALEEQPLPIYGDGQNIRDWLYVSDHCAAIRLVLKKGKPGNTYNIGGNAEKTNLEVVRMICAILDRLRPRARSLAHAELITFVKDRPGHDRRYMLDTTKIQQELGWKPRESFETGLLKTVLWYLDHLDWVSNVVSGRYQQWLAVNYQNRGTA